MNDDCHFCHFKNKYLILKEYKYWNLSLSESQVLIGWCQASLKRHILFFEELDDKELQELKTVVSDWKRMVEKFHPDWFNVMQMGNLVKHLHFQLVPRYKNEVKYEKRIFTDKSYGRPVLDIWEPEKDEFLLRLKRHLLQ